MVGVLILPLSTVHTSFSVVGPRTSSIIGAEAVVTNSLLASAVNPCSREISLGSQVFPLKNSSAESADFDPIQSGYKSLWKASLLRGTLKEIGSTKDT